MVYVGCAGWSIPRAQAEGFPGPGTHLERYARVLAAVEINSSFYRAHRPSTYARWAGAVPDGFTFSVKLPKEISHLRRLENARDPLDRFLSDIAALGPKLGPLLLQLPPSLRFNLRIAARFFETLRALYSGAVLCEPRHADWFAPSVNDLLESFKVVRVAADPVPRPSWSEPGGWKELVYYRLHGSPRRYYSAYSGEFLSSLAATLSRLERASSVWCIFDNTAAGAAAQNALALVDRLELHRRGRGDALTP